MDNVNSYSPKELQSDELKKARAELRERFSETLRMVRSELSGKPLSESEIDILIEKVSKDTRA